MNAGIDYGRGLSNRDTDTGIRYGVISQNAVNPDACDDIYQNGRNLSYESALEYAKSEYQAGIDAMSAEDAEDAEPFDEDGFNDGCYSDGDDQYLYESDGYVLETTLLGIYITKSLYYTLAMFCSPCCPGAGNLESPSDNGVKTYCLGFDWFDSDSPCEYRIFNVPDDSEVFA